VIPLVKKPSLDKEDLKHYRPVSNLPYVGKITEKMVVSRLESFLSENKLHEPLQSAYSANHSVETALLKVTKDILHDIEKKQCVLLVLIDQSAAFDTISHDTFLDRLQCSYGITGQPLLWMKSYFSNRYQSVSINGKTSKPVALDTGFPQGSNIGPSGFKIYTKPLTAIAQKHGISIHLYADDTQLYIAFDSETVCEAVAQMETCICEIKSWLCENSLKMNDSKTEFVVLGSKAQLATLPKISLKIGTASINPTRTARNIGAIFDDTLCMVDHINHVQRSCYMQIRNISKIRKYLSQDATAKLVQALVISRLDNLNSLLYGIPQHRLQKLQLIQNNAARLILRKRASDHVTPMLKELHWLPLEYRIMFKILLVTFKSLNGIAPAYISDLIKPYMPQRSLRSENLHLLHQPKARLKLSGDRAFFVSAPKLWNNMPLSMRKCNSLTEFKTGLKTHFYRMAFLNS
jgi:hypothetical protein